ncbi:MAG: hypothetical protein ACYDBB_07425 [Armatimonadota bacterium]
MPRSILTWTTFLLGVLCLAAPVLAETEVPALPPVDVAIERPTAPPATPDSPRIAITFTSDATGNLFLSNQPIAVTAHLVNPGNQVEVKITTAISSGFGCQVDVKSYTKTLPAKGEILLPVTYQNTYRLPNGSYLVEAWVELGAIGYGSTHIGIWNSPLGKGSECVGISYAGSLDADRTWRDLDLFKMAGVGWLRFPLQGWLSQGSALPPHAVAATRFVEEAGKRSFSLLAAFTPRVTVDPSINEVQTNQEYRESLLNAATRYGAKVKSWELLCVRPDPMYPDLKGIDYPQLAYGREGLQRYDKSLQAIYTIDYPYRDNAPGLFSRGLPAKGDGIGMHYNFVGWPEVARATPIPPVYSLPELKDLANKTTKRVPPVWVTEYGFDPQKESRIPHPLHQAAHLSRALIINRLSGIERTFWRHDPASRYDVPFIDADGGVEPTFLALRTTLQMLEGVTQVTEVPMPFANGVAYLLQYGEAKKRKRGPKAHYALVAWAFPPMGSSGMTIQGASIQSATGVTLRTSAKQITVTDLWGNTVELKPTDNIALFQVDEFPRFLDLGQTTDIELHTPFAGFKPARLNLRDNPDRAKNENAVMYFINNDQRFFTDNKHPTVFDLIFRRWPDIATDKDDLGVKTERITLEPYSRVERRPFELSLPKPLHKGQIYEISMDIMRGTRRIGYLTLPAWYLPPGEEAGK